jgi:hypothetical protein
MLIYSILLHSMFFNIPFHIIYIPWNIFYSNPFHSIRFQVFHIPYEFGDCKSFFFLRTLEKKVILVYIRAISSCKNAIKCMSGSLHRVPDRQIIIQLYHVYIQNIEIFKHIRFAIISCFK